MPQPLLGCSLMPESALTGVGLGKITGERDYGFEDAFGHDGMVESQCEGLKGLLGRGEGVGVFSRRLLPRLGGGGQD